MDRPPEALVALNDALRRIPIDLRELGRVARFFALPVSQLLKLCNSSIFALDRPVHNLEHAAISLGADALRSLGQAWGFVHRVGNLLAPSQAREFWRHNLAVALISERIAAWRCYSTPDAYLAGFLHDIGRVPLMIANQEQQAPLRNYDWRAESIQAETLAFGIDHCELGIRIARRWDFPQPFLKVVGDHHQLEVEGDEPELVRIVSAAEALCSQPRSAAAEGSPCSCLDHHRSVLSRRLPDLDSQEIRTLAEALTMELLFAPRGDQPGLRKSISSRTPVRVEGARTERQLSGRRRVSGDLASV